MQISTSGRWLAVALAVGTLSLGGCIHRHRGGTARCADPRLPAVVQDNPPLKVGPGMTAPDTRNAVAIPPLPAGPAAAAAADAKAASAAPCLSVPPSYKG